MKGMVSSMLPSGTAIGAAVVFRVVTFVVPPARAEPPDDYYDDATGKSGALLPSWICVSEVSFHHLPMRRYVQARFRQGTVQPDVLRRQARKWRRLGHLQPAVTRPPLVNVASLIPFASYRQTGEIIRD